MVKITLDLNKSVNQNAGTYFDRSKKFKKKIEGAKEALEDSKKKLKRLEKKQSKEVKETVVKISRKPEWYEKFRWFISSEGFLCLGGRDATTNEILIKKHTEKNDIVFHTDMAGSPFFIIKTDNKKPKEATLKETADATVSFSRVWKLGMQNSPVFYVNPDQVSKEPQSGEYLSKGAFMIYGKTNYIDNKVNVAVGQLDDGRIMAGPVEAIKANCKKFVLLEQGKEKTSKIAKFIQKKLGGDLDDIIRVMPSGGCKVKK